MSTKLGFGPECFTLLVPTSPSAPLCSLSAPIPQFSVLWVLFLMAFTHAWSDPAHPHLLGLIRKLIMVSTNLVSEHSSSNSSIPSLVMAPETWIPSKTWYASIGLQTSSIQQQVGAVVRHMNSLETLLQTCESWSSSDDMSHLSSCFKPRSVEFPQFDGSTDLAAWKYKANRYFYFNRTPDGHKVSTAVFCHEAEDLQWFWYFTILKESIT